MVWSEHDVDLDLIGSHLHSYGVTSTPLHTAVMDGDIGIVSPAGELRLEIQVLSRPTLTELAQFAPPSRWSRILIVAGHVGERSGAALREKGVQFVDEAGNAFIRVPGLHVDVRGRTPRTRSYPPRRKDSSDLFSAKRAQLLFVLITWPHLIDAPLRLLADIAGVSLGLAQSTMKTLQTDALVRVEPDLTSLIDPWASAYPFSLGPSLRIRDLLGDPHLPLVPGDEEILVSGEAATPWIVHAPTLTIYTPRFTPSLAIANRWRVGDNPNIFVRRRFWNPHPDLTPSRQAQTAPPLLVYADLLASGDSRQREAALQMRGSDGRLLPV